jgi:type IV pilus assembly protein PilV
VIDRQQGVMLIEALVAILIFSLGILGLVALGGQAVGAQSDAQYRTEASGIADAIAGEIAVNVDRRNNGLLIAGSLPAFSHQAGGANCVFAGGPSTNARILALVNRAATLPGASGLQQQITVQNGAGAFNRVEVTLCWRTANDNGAWRRHTYVTYVNGGAN